MGKPTLKKDPCRKAFAKHVFNYLQSLKELSQMSFQTRILRKLWLSPWTTSSTFLKIIQATLINIMKVNEDWAVKQQDVRKHHKTVKKVINSLCDKQTKFKWLFTDKFTNVYLIWIFSINCLIFLKFEGPNFHELQLLKKKKNHIIKRSFVFQPTEESKWICNIKNARIVIFGWTTVSL